MDGHEEDAIGFRSAVIPCPEDGWLRLLQRILDTNQSKIITPNSNVHLLPLTPGSSRTRSLDFLQLSFTGSSKLFATLIFKLTRNLSSSIKELKG